MFKSTIVILFLALFFLPQLQAKVLVLTSLDEASNRPPLRFRSWDINEKLEKIAKKKLKDFDVEIHHHVTQIQLYHHLQRRDIKALIWVSHSSGPGLSSNPALSSVQILDYQNRDLAPLFYRLPDQLEYFALVGCQSGPILKSWNTNERIRLNHPLGLQYFLEKRKVDARRSLKRAIKQLRSSQGLADLDDESDNEDDEFTQTLILKVTRNSEAFPLTSARLMFDDQVVAIFSPINANQKQMVEVQIKFSKVEISRLKLILESGGGSRETEQMGRLSIHTTEGGNWKLFTKPDGTPIGIGTHIYRYQIQDN